MRRTYVSFGCADVALCRSADATMKANRTDAMFCRPEPRLCKQRHNNNRSRTHRHTGEAQSCFTGGVRQNGAFYNPTPTHWSHTPPSSLDLCSLLPMPKGVPFPKSCMKTSWQEPLLHFPWNFGEKQGGQSGEKHCVFWKVKRGTATCSCHDDAVPVTLSMAGLSTTGCLRSADNPLGTLIWNREPFLNFILALYYYSLPSFSTSWVPICTQLKQYFCQY